LRREVRRKRKPCNLTDHKDGRRKNREARKEEFWIGRAKNLRENKKCAVNGASE